MQWLPLHVPGNVRVIVTATDPDPNYLQLHEQKIRQHMMNPHQESVSQLSSVSNAGGEASSGDDAMGPGQTAETGAGEAEHESSHRRRKVGSMRRCSIRLSLYASLCVNKATHDHAIVFFCTETFYVNRRKCRHVNIQHLTRTSKW